jgi:hypothetical protein
MRRSRGNAAGRRGGSTRVKSSDGQEFDHDPSKEALVPPSPDPTKTATVGLSVSIGQSTEYAREKFEVSAWCTLPCRPNEEDMQDTYEECYSWVTRELERRSDDVVDKFFPHIGKE